MARIDILSYVGEYITAAIVDEVKRRYPELASYLLDGSFKGHKSHECK
jgi:hypothetical protein